MSAGASYSWLIDRRWHAAMGAVLRCGVRWEGAATAELARIRRSLPKGENWELRRVLEALLDPSVCAPEILRELTRTSAMKKRLLEVGLIRPEAKPPSERELRRQKVARLTAPFDRGKLCDEVWQKPVSHLAGDYGVSGAYLGEVCRTLATPAPPRAYRPRVRSGQTVKQPKVPILRH